MLTWLQTTVARACERDVLERLKTLTEVKEAYILQGVYDIIARVVTETTERLRQVVTRKIRNLDFRARIQVIGYAVALIIIYTLF